MAADVTVQPLQLVALEHAGASRHLHGHIDDPFGLAVARCDRHQLGRPQSAVVHARRPVRGDAIDVGDHGLELEGPWALPALLAAGLVAARQGAGTEALGVEHVGEQGQGLGHAVGVDGVQPEAIRSAGLDEAGTGEGAEVVTNQRLGHTLAGDKVADAALGLVEGEEEPESGGVGQGAGDAEESVRSPRWARLPSTPLAPLSQRVSEASRLHRHDAAIRSRQCPVHLGAGQDDLDHQPLDVARAAVGSASRSTASGCQYQPSAAATSSRAGMLAGCRRLQSCRRSHAHVDEPRTERLLDARRPCRSVQTPLVDP